MFHWLLKTYGTVHTVRIDVHIQCTLYNELKIMFVQLYDCDILSKPC